MTILQSSLQTILQSRLKTILQSMITEICQHTIDNTFVCKHIKIIIILILVYTSNYTIVQTFNYTIVRSIDHITSHTTNHAIVQTINHTIVQITDYSPVLTKNCFIVYIPFQKDSKLLNFHPTFHLHSLPKKNYQFIIDFLYASNIIEPQNNIFVCGMICMSNISFKYLFPKTIYDMYFFYYVYLMDMNV